MPIPKLSGAMTRTEINEAYARMDWSKDLQIEWVQVNSMRGTMQKRTIDFKADALPCSSTPNCGIGQLNYIQFKPTGIVKTCGTCRKTEGPISMTLGRQIEVKDVSLDEAWDTVERTGQRPPIGMKPRPSGSVFTIIE